MILHYYSRWMGAKDPSLLQEVDGCKGSFIITRGDLVHVWFV